MNVTIVGEHSSEASALLTPEALAFLTQLHQTFEPRRQSLLEERVVRQKKLDAGEHPSFLSETAAIRADDFWLVASTPPDLQKRWVEITGPTDSKMLINALNSGADVFMADFEDANSPTWKNMVEGQLNLTQAIAGTLTFEGAEGKQYRLKPKVSVLMVRPRGWHRLEEHLMVDGQPIAASWVVCGLFFFRSSQ